MSNGKRRCFAKGQLVGARYWIPEHEAEYNPGGGIVPAIGCNRLRCETCKIPVRVLHGVYLKDPEHADLGAFYEAAGQPSGTSERIGSLLEDKGVNLYVCRCHAHSERGTQHIDGYDELRMLSLPWACSGHGWMTFPGTIDGLRVDFSQPLPDLVYALLMMHGESLHVGYRHLAGGFQAARVYRQLPEADERERFSNAVAEHLTHKEPGARASALNFFRQEPRASGTRAVLSLKRKRKLWNVPDPNASDGTTLREGALERAVAAIERAQNRS